jgi:hypothetical protein
MAAGKNNLMHALSNDCHDPDCEIHNPEVIEDDNSRLTALAWFYAGAVAADPEVANHPFTNVLKTLGKEV